MNKNVLIVLAGGFLIAVLVALLVQASLSGAKKEAPVVASEEPKVQIIVASKDIKIGTDLTEEHLKWQEWPKAAVFPGAIVKEDDKKPNEAVTGKVIRDVRAGEPITLSALVPETAANLLAATLDKGKRAVAINVNASGMVGGFVGPGDYVDILLTYRRAVNYEGPENPEIETMIERNLDSLATETILQNIKVLAVDQSAARDEEGGVKVGKTVTLEVDYGSAEVLAVAMQMGTLSLSLRSLGDESVLVEKPPVTTDARITKIYDELFSEVSKMQDNSGQNRKIVRIYRGDVVQDIPVSP